MGISSNSKYENAIGLKLTTARSFWSCSSCQRDINPGESYYRQSLGRIGKPPDVCLRAFCLACEDSPLARKLIRQPRSSTHPRSSLSDINEDISDEPPFGQHRLF